ncbi:MAG: TRL-like family protein [Leptospiraceae bacterium]|nr:TRL-like family protein [Leptospiraceae bacterium]
MASLISCATPGFGPIGTIYTGTKIGIWAVSPNGAKTGKACVVSYLGIIAEGDGSVEAASKNAGITKVNNINLEGFSVLGIYSELCTLVQGD